MSAESQEETFDFFTKTLHFYLSKNFFPTKYSRKVFPCSHSLKRPQFSQTSC